MFKITNLSFKREKTILENISFSIKKGHLISIVGKSGVGKSTLLSCLAGLMPINNGKIKLNNKLQLFENNSLIPGFKDIVLMNQNFSLDLYHNVFENINNACYFLVEEVRFQWINELLNLFELTELKNQKAINLSGGEQQRLAFAIALAKEPDVLLLDEPFSNIDVHIKEKLINFLLLLKKRQKTAIIMVTHNGTEALQISDEIIFLNNGKIDRIAKPEDFYFCPTSEYEAAFFGKINTVKIKNNIINFRPHQFETVENCNNISLKLNFIKKHFLGIYCLHEYSYKNSRIFLNQINDLILEEIFIKNVV